MAGYHNLGINLLSIMVKFYSHDSTRYIGLQPTKDCTHQNDQCLELQGS